MKKLQNLIAKLLGFKPNQHNRTVSAVELKHATRHAHTLCRLQAKTRRHLDHQRTALQGYAAKLKLVKEGRGHNTTTGIPA